MPQPMPMPQPAPQPRRQPAGGLDFGLTPEQHGGGGGGDGTTGQSTGRSLDQYVASVVESVLGQSPENRCSRQFSERF